MQKIHKLAFILAASAAVASCAASDDDAREPSTEQTSTSEAAVSPIATGPVRAGYVHALERSKFSIGGKAVSRAEFGMQKSMGDQGVFATLPTGLTLGMPNADATARQKAPYPGGADAQNKAVRAYFVDAGLPADQISEVVPFAAMHSEGAVADGLKGAMGNAKLGYYFSVLRRHVDGIPVADSLAWARLNVDGEVVMESMYWPAIPEAVITKARAAQTRLADPATHSALMAKVPGATEGSLVIHHTPGFYQGAFEAVATYDIAGDGGKVHHFDITGQAVDLAEERPEAWGKSETSVK
jgi:hypothetical protein